MIEIVFWEHISRTFASNLLVQHFPGLTLPSIVDIPIKVLVYNCVACKHDSTQLLLATYIYAFYIIPGAMFS